MDVVILGPNLKDQDKGQFHVHTADCADVDKMVRREPAYAKKNRMVIDADSRQEIVEWLYEDHMAERAAENDGEVDWRDFDDVYLFPCVKLPDDSSEEDEPEEEDDTEGDEEEEDVPDPFADNVELAKRHGASDGKATANDALTREAILGYLDENLPEEVYEEMSSYDLDRVVSNYVGQFISSFSEQCRATLKSFLDSDAALYLDEENDE